ncbi:MAG: hypothetical protein L3J08_06725 [Flavobacteriaceae bacterium]|nr:hypothetical protein [Flavobacteriaceae bacterium]
MQKKNVLDYFSGGMAMPGRNVVGDYRYDFQGQELDRETGKHAFELRLYDSRINRWISPDPYGEFHSPYLSMGNNWINKIDPDGGQTEDIIYLDSDGNEINRFVMDGPDIYLQETYSGGIQDGLNVGSFENVTNKLNPSTIRQQVLFGLTYPGGDNPTKYNGKPDYTFIPDDLSEYPAIGHDRRYDNLGVAGASGLFTDTRAIGADYKFVSEELQIASNPFLPIKTRLYSGILGVGLGLAALPKTLYKFGTSGYPYNTAILEISVNYHISNHGVTNAPAKQ